MTNKSTAAFLLSFLLIAAYLSLACMPATSQEAAVREAPVPAAVEPALDIPNVRTPLENVVTGGQPSLATLQEAAEKGFRTVIDLRPEAETEDLPFRERHEVEALGMSYVSIPIAGAGDLTVANTEALATVLDDPERRPALLHCASGNRVGAILALRAFLVDGASAEEAMELGKRAGLTRLEPVVEEILRQESP